jgi:hypothetical protein
MKKTPATKTDAALLKAAAKGDLKNVRQRIAADVVKWPGRLARFVGPVAQRNGHPLPQSTSSPVLQFNRRKLPRLAKNAQLFLASKPADLSKPL